MAELLLHKNGQRRFYSNCNGMKNTEQGIENGELRKTLVGEELEERLIEFAIRVLNVVDALPKSQAGKHVASQLIRSGTSPASNYGEARSAESRNDFIHKMKIGLKELRETHIWLKIVHQKPLVENSDRLEPLVQECNELTAIFVSSVNTAEANK